MEFGSCREGGSEDTRFSGSTSPGVPVQFRSPSSRARARSIALMLAQTAAVVCKIKTAAKGVKNEEIENLCDGFEHQLLSLNITLDKMDCRTEEKDVFDTMEKEAACVFRWLAGKRREEITREDLAEQEGRLVYIAMLCNAMGNESLGAVKKKPGFLQLCGESAEGLWWLTVRTCICAARERVVELMVDKQKLRREKEIRLFLSTVAGIMQDLITGVMSMLELVECMGGATTPVRPGLIDEVVIFSQRVLKRVKVLQTDRREVLALGQRSCLEDWIIEEFENLTSMALPVPCVGSWYIA